MKGSQFPPNNLSVDVQHPMNLHIVCPKIKTVSCYHGKPLVPTIAEVKQS